MELEVKSQRMDYVPSVPLGLSDYILAALLNSGSETTGSLLIRIGSARSPLTSWVTFRLSRDSKKVIKPLR